MCYSIKYLLIIPLLLVILVLAGPIVDIDDTLHTQPIPENIDKYLQDSEKRFPDIRPGTEKTIIWNNPLQHIKTPVSIVYLHGFSATRQEVAPLCDRLAKSLEANLYYTRLTGHGRNSEAMANITVNNLLNDAAESLEIGKKIGQKVILVGTSTGGTLATWLASQTDNQDILALVLLSPNYGFKRADAELLLLPWGNLIARLVIGENYHFVPVNDAQERYWTTTYSSQALLPMMGLVKLIQHSHLNRIQSPTLVLYSSTDTLLDTAAIHNTLEKFSSDTRQLLPIDNTGDPQRHIVAGDILSPQTTQQVSQAIYSFIKPLL